MFIVAAAPTFTHTVTAMVPIDGGFERQPFKVTYNVISPEEMAGMDLGTREGTDKFLRAVIHSLDEVAGDDKQPIPYSDALREKVLALPWARSAIARGYLEAIGKTAEGN